MRFLRPVGGALAALLLLAAIGATVAIGLENPEILPNPTAATPLKFTSKGGVAALNSAAGIVNAQSSITTGEFTSARLGKVTLDFLGIKSSGVPCNSVGDEKGTILVPNADVHLVDILPGGVLTLGFAITPATNVVIKCGTIAIEIKGTVIGQVDSVTSGASIPAGAIRTLLFRPTTTGGVSQLFKTCDLDKTFCEGKTYGLLAEFGTGFKEAAEEAANEAAFSKTVTIDF